MRISIIVAMARNGVIGRDGRLPWKIPEDLKRFKALTMGKPIVMGKKTFLSIGKPLPGRINIVITGDQGFRPPGVHVAESFEQALAKAKELAGGDAEIMIIGGAKVYKEALALAWRMYVTEVHDRPKGDVCFPEYDRRQWREVSREAGPSSGEALPDYDFTVLERI